MIVPTANDSSSVPAEQSAEHDLREERCWALRALLRQPLWVASGAAGQQFTRIRRTAPYLREWLQRYTGWVLIVRNDSVRLLKRPVDYRDYTRGVVDASNQQAFTRRRYVLWCLALAALCDEGQQTTLRRVGDQVLRIARSEPNLEKLGVTFDLRENESRRSFVAVIRQLIHYGVLDRVEGDEQQYLAGEGDCLFTIRQPVLADLLIARRNFAELDAIPSLARLEALTRDGEECVDDYQLAARQVEQRLFRRLLDDPIIYFSDLTEREYVYWQSQRRRIIDVIEAATGLVCELRSEGVAMLDPDDQLTDIKMPEPGTVGHASLLVSEFLASRLAADKQQNQQSLFPELRGLHCKVRYAELEEFMQKLVQEHAAHWRKGVREPAQTRLLLTQVLRRLESLRLIQRQGQMIFPMEAVARFAVDRSQAAERKEQGE